MGVANPSGRFDMPNAIIGANLRTPKQRTKDKERQDEERANELTILDHIDTLLAEVEDPNQ